MGCEPRTADHAVDDGRTGDVHVGAQACTSPVLDDRKAAVDCLVDLHGGALGERIFEEGVFPCMDARMRRLVRMYLEPVDGVNGAA